MSSLTAITAGPVAIAPRRARLAVLLGVVVALVFALAPPLAVAQPQPQPHTDPARSDRIPHPEDPDMQIWFYRCNHRSPVELNPLITRYKSAAGQVIDYPENNTLLIVDTPERMKLLARILRQADVPRAQVMIEVKVISLTYSSDFQLGAESTWDLASKTDGNNATFFRGWNLSFQPEDFIRSLNANANELNPNFREKAEDDFQGTTLKFKALGGSQARLGSLDLAVRMLQGTGRASIVARPSVLVETGYKARIEAGQEVPIQNQQLINNTPIVGVEYRTVGTTLSLEPHMVGPDWVELTVEPEVSSVTRFFDPGGSGLTNPLIQRSGAKTRVVLRSGETLEIGGLRSTRSLIQQTGIPFLMELPILGYLFRASRKELRRQDIVFFITPTILDSVEATAAPSYARAITREFEALGSGRDDARTPTPNVPRTNGGTSGDD